MKTNLFGYSNKPKDIYKDFYVLSWIVGEGKTIKPAKSYSYTKDLLLEIHHVHRWGYWQPVHTNENFKTDLKNYFGFVYFNEHQIVCHYSQAFTNLDQCIEHSIKWWWDKKATADKLQLSLI